MARRKRYFVLDTNVLLADANALRSFKTDDVIIPFAVLEELDHFKKRMDSVGVNCRAASRFLEDLRTKGNLYDGVRISKGLGLLHIAGISPQNVPGLDQSVPDNKIIATALDLEKKFINNEVILVSRDINVRLKASATGLVAQDYLTDRVVESSDDIYTGVTERFVPNEMIDRLYSDKKIQYLDSEGGIFPNEFVLLKSNIDAKSSALTMYKKGYLYLITKQNRGEIKPRNKEQTCALAALRDPDIKVVTLIGIAGCGKTLLSLFVGCEALNNENGDGFVADKLVITRPIEPLGRDLGYLPGTMDEKMEPWMKPIYDNLSLFMPEYEMKEERIHVEPLTYIRGRSINNAFIILDEGQNISRHEIKTMLTRVGQNTKIVITGDIKQIDNIHVDEFSNGLTHVVDAFKKEELAAHVTLVKGERSEVATMASRLL